MQHILSFILTGVALFVAVPVLMFSIEVLAAVFPARGQLGLFGSRPAIAVLVPAHNESSGVLPTLQDINAQLRPGDRLIVIADNCTDDTVASVSLAGFEVLERTDPSKRGKGPALDFAIRAISANAPAIIIIIDADCRVGEGTIDLLASWAATTGRPIQALDLMVAPVNSEVDHRVSEFAWRVKNWMRPLGLSKLGLPCQLMGTGMAIPYKALGKIEIASGGLVEDLNLGLELALAGSPPLFCPGALVTSCFPETKSGSTVQRERWEHGHLSLIAHAVPRAIRGAVKRRDIGLLALALDLCVPPLSFLMFLFLLSFVLAALEAAFGFSKVPLMMSLGTALVFFTGVGAAWTLVGRDLMSPQRIAALPLYVFRKLGIYSRLLTKRGSSIWVRTERGENRPDL
jgi:cellulose synthase/poly-beta-1,6-N-acetylglucosamine synthase-like glycosyltransferase